MGQAASMGSLLLAGGPFPTPLSLTKLARHNLTLPRNRSSACFPFCGFLTGEKGHRSCLARSRVMIHQPSGGASGRATDLAIRAEEILKTRRRLTDIYALHCRVVVGEGDKGKLESEEACRERYERALERDFFLDPEEALKFGLIDRVVQCVFSFLCLSLSPRSLRSGRFA